MLNVFTSKKLTLFGVLAGTVLLFVILLFSIQGFLNNADQKDMEFDILKKELLLYKEHYNRDFLKKPNISGGSNFVFVSSFLYDKELNPDNYRFQLDHDRSNEDGLVVDFKFPRKEYVSRQFNLGENERAWAILLVHSLGQLRIPPGAVSLENMDYFSLPLKLDVTTEEYQVFIEVAFKIENIQDQVEYAFVNKQVLTQEANIKPMKFYIDDFILDRTYQPVISLQAITDEIDRIDKEYSYLSQFQIKFIFVDAIPSTISKKDFENRIVPLLIHGSDADFLKSVYSQDSAGDYHLEEDISNEDKIHIATCLHYSKFVTKPHVNYPDAVGSFVIGNPSIRRDKIFLFKDPDNFIRAGIPALFITIIILLVVIAVFINRIGRKKMIFYMNKNRKLKNDIHIYKKLLTSTFEVLPDYVCWKLESSKNVFTKNVIFPVQDIQSVLESNRGEPSIIFFIDDDNGQNKNTVYNNIIELHSFEAHSVQHTCKWFLFAAFLVTREHGWIKVPEYKINDQHSIISFFKHKLPAFTDSFRHTSSPVYVKLNELLGDAILEKRSQKPLKYYGLNSVCNYLLVLHKDFIDPAKPNKAFDYKDCIEDVNRIPKKRKTSV